MTTLSRNARVAGLLYLTLMTAPLRLIYIPAHIIVSGNAAATAKNVAAHETLFRLGILSDLLRDDGHLPHAGAVPAVQGS